MKKIIALTLALLLAAAFCTAFADENIKVVDKNLLIDAADGDGYFFAKVENQSSSDVYADYGSSLVLFDDSDEIILSEDYVSTLPSGLKLAAGEYAYCREFLYDSALENATVADYKFSPKSETSGTDYTRLESECSFEYQGADSYDNCVIVTFTNTTEDVLFDYYVTGALYDQNGQLIFADSAYSSAIGVNPGSTLTVKLSIDRTLSEYYDANSLVPTTVDAIVYAPVA